MVGGQDWFRTEAEPLHRTALCSTAADIVREACPWILVAYPKKYSVRHIRLGNDLPTDFPWGTEKNLSLP